MKKLSRIPEMVVWLLFSVLICSGYAFSFLMYAAGYTQVSVFHVVIAALICLLLSGIGVVYVRVLQGRQWFSNFSKTEWILLEIGILLLLFIGGYVFRFADSFAGIWQHNLEDTFFNYAQVMQNRVTYANPHLISRMYVGILHIACLFFGNIYEIGAILQFALQLLGVVVWYTALRKLWGRAAALLFVFGVMLLPDSIRHSVQCDPTMLLFLIYGCTVLCIAYYVKSHISLKQRVFMEALMGILAAFCVLADISGLLVLFGLVCALHNKHRFLSDSFGAKCLPVLAGLLAGMISTVVIQTCVYDISVMDAVLLQSYRGLTVSLPDGAFWHRYAVKLGMHSVFLLAVPVILAYWFIRSKKVLTYIMAAILYLFAVQLLQLDVYIDHDFLIYTMLLILAAMTWKLYMQAHKVEEPSVTVVCFDDQPAVEVPQISEEAPAIFIPKSLTIPKRERKAKVDYAIEVKEEQLHYDISVDEASDFDVN